jgi:ATP-dependent Lon protease
MAEKQIVPADQVLPNKLHIMPLGGKPIFPGIFTPMLVTNKEDVQIVDLALSKGGFLGLLLIQDSEVPEPTTDDLVKVGSVVKIVRKINLPDGGFNIFISGVKRFSVAKFINTTAPFTAAIKYLDDENEGSDEVKALTRSLVTEMKQILENNPFFSEEMRLNMVNIDQPGRIADFIASILNIDRLEQQRILENLDVRKRMEQVLLHIKKEQELLNIQKKIQKQINKKITKSQREYFLREELKAIKAELGMPTDAKSQEYQRLKEAFAALELEGEAKEQAEQELEKFAIMEPNSSEFIVTRNYLETIASLPWRDPEPEQIDMKKAQRILEADHYCLEDVKERILEYMAVRKLKKDTKGSILCLVGPPGWERPLWANPYPALWVGPFSVFLSVE